MRATVIFTFLLGLALPVSAMAQDDGEAPPVNYPAVAERGVDATAFVPAGWGLEQDIRGDLNKDGAEDLVLVLHDKDPANLIKVEQGIETPLDTNPRMLAVALADKTGGYRLVLANSSIIPRVLYSNESDPLTESGGVSIDRGSLVVGLYYFYSSGGSDTGNVSYRFRYENNDFRLIGHDRTNVNRMSGEIEIISANFLNRKVIVRTGSISDDTDKVTSKRLKSGAVVKIGDITDPWGFAPDY